VAVPGDLVLTMGAGDVTKLGPLILDDLAAVSGAAASGTAASGTARP
jgi:UDP-N-acetylmuramate--alanine ligase